MEIHWTDFQPTGDSTSLKTEWIKILKDKKENKYNFKGNRIAEKYEAFIVNNKVKSQVMQKKSKTFLLRNC